MSAESALRDALLASAPLLAAVPAERISWDAVDQAAAKPYLALSKESETRDRGLDGTTLAHSASFSILCVGTDRANAIAVADLVRAALAAAQAAPNATIGPSDNDSAGYDPELDLEVEVVGADYFT